MQNVLCIGYIEWIQFSSSDQCCSGTGSKMIYNVMSNLCDYVQTSSGDTWQRLVDYDTNGCTAGYVDLSAYGSILTEENCNDETFVPIGYSEVLEGDNVISCEDETSVSFIDSTFLSICICTSSSLTQQFNCVSFSLRSLLLSALTSQVLSALSQAL